MIQLLLKYPEITPSTRGYELLKTTLDLHGIEYTEDSDLGIHANLVITDYFLHDSPVAGQEPEIAWVNKIAQSCQQRSIPILWYYPGESFYTEAVVYNPTGRLAAELTVPTFLVKSGDRNDGDLLGFTKVFNLEYYHIYQVLNKFNRGRLISTRQQMLATPKDKKFLYLNGMAREHRVMLYEGLRDNGLLENSIWSWRDLKHGLAAPGIDPEVNWSDDKLMINQFRYQCFYPEQYSRTEFSVVVETANDEHFVSEKTAKCLVLGHPFMVLGSQNYLQRLQSWGFQTFGHVIDESYDRFHLYDGKIPRMVDEIQKLCAGPDIFQECLAQTEHNLQHSLYLAEKIHADLLQVILQASEQGVSIDKSLSCLSDLQISQYLLA